MFDTKSYFNFAPSQPSNKLGIFPTIIVQIEFLANEEQALWRTNSNFADADMVSSFRELCGLQKTTQYSAKEGDYLSWGNCTFNNNQITAFIEEGNPEPWHRNFTYFEIKTKMFVGRKNDVRHECVLNEFPGGGRKAYIVLATNTFKKRGGTVHEPIYKLDMFLPMALSFFEDIIEEDKILQFPPMDFLNQTPHYKCMLGIASGQSIEELKSTCRFKCVVIVKEKDASGRSKDKDNGVRTSGKKVTGSKNTNSSREEL